MSHVLSSFVALVLFLTSTQVYAQEATPTFPAPNLTGGEGAGPLQCLDYYDFGSVSADLQTNIEATVPGATITFSGQIVNQNDYPLINGALYVKIFRRSETTLAAGDGNEVVDQFVVSDKLTLRANNQIPLEYNWTVPMNAAGGEYYAAYFFVTEQRYNLMGLSSTDDVVGNIAPFSVTSDIQPIKLSKSDTTINGQDYNFTAPPVRFDVGEPITVKTTITNTSSEARSVPLQWNQYAWDEMNPNNLRNTKTELVTLAPNETKEISYTAKEQRGSATLITVTTEDQGSKSILNIRYIHEGIIESHINFQGLSAFPIAKNTEVTLFVCAQPLSLPVVKDATILLSLKDRDGKVVHEYSYEGDITSALSGFGDTFKPASNINYATLTATLKDKGIIVDEVTQVFDCETIDPTTCFPDDKYYSFIDLYGMKLLLGALVLFGLTLLIFVWKFFIRHRNMHIDATRETI